MDYQGEYFKHGTPANATQDSPLFEGESDNVKKSYTYYKSRATQEPMLWVTVFNDGSTQAYYSPTGVCWNWPARFSKQAFDWARDRQQHMKNLRF